MTTNQNINWSSIVGLVEQLKKCDQNDLITASIAMAFICIDSLASLARPIQAQKVTRTHFMEWVDCYLKADHQQPYQYRGKDIYAARCALIHTYGSESELHTQDPDIRKFVYHDGGMHQYDADKDPSLVIIGSKSFVNDVVHAVDFFLEKCESDLELKIRVEQRLANFMREIPLIPNTHPNTAILQTASPKNQQML